MSSFSRLRQRASQSEDIETLTVRELALRLPADVWRRLPGAWPEFLRKFVFLAGKAYAESECAPLSGWRHNDFLTPVVEAIAKKNSLLQRLPDTLQQRVLGGIQPGDLSEEDRHSLYCLWVYASDPLQVRPPRECTEAVGKGRFRLPPSGFGRLALGRKKHERDQHYDMMRTCFEQFALETDRSDVFVGNLGHGFFNDEEWLVWTPTGTRWTSGPRNTAGRTRQNWWFFILPVDTGFVVCWPVVTLTGHSVEWTIYLAVCKDMSWKVCHWYDGLSDKDKRKVAELSKQPLPTNGAKDPLRVWMARPQMPFIGRESFPNVSRIGWVRVAPEFEERRDIETSSAASLALFVTQLMLRTVAAFSGVAHAQEHPGMQARGRSWGNSGADAETDMSDDFERSDEESNRDAGRSGQHTRSGGQPFSQYANTGPGHTRRTGADRDAYD